LERAANDERYDDMNGMMWGMGLFGLLIVVALVLVVAALIKHRTSAPSMI
jgi:CHASE1-domain containing sensor protein